MGAGHQGIRLYDLGVHHRKQGSLGVRVAAPLRVYVHVYQHKGMPFLKALYEAGCVVDKKCPDVALFDKEWDSLNPEKEGAIVKRYLERGASILVYPHAATAPWWYDGIIDIKPCVKAVLVIGSGQKEITNVINPAIKTHVAGWPFCEQREFIRPDKVKRILFCPIHPANQYIRQESRDANERVLRSLIEYSKKKSVDVTVRYIGDLELQGLHNCDRFKFIEGATDGSTIDIDGADLVIAEGTCMYASVARGKPTIGMIQHMPIRSNSRYEQGHHWSKYGPAMAYPINFESAPLPDLIDAAMTEQEEWRWLFIGESMTPERLLRVVENTDNAHR
jgi:hypothetical protein